jgi:hypothetical protein
MAERTITLPAFGKIIELRKLDDFIWATLHGWGALPARKVLNTLRSLKADSSTEGAELTEDLKEEEEYFRLTNFTSDQSKNDYPYLFSLVSVRLWAMVEAAAREFVEEVVKHRGRIPKPEALAKLKGPIAPFIGADSEVQAELLADVVWRSVEGEYVGVNRFEAVLEKLGFPSRLHGVLREIFTELAEVRHCVVHRNALVDRRLLQHCPWLQLSVGAPLPATVQRYWFYRTAAYCYIIDLVRRWSEWFPAPQLVKMANDVEAPVLEELIRAWATDKIYPSRETTAA